MAGSNRYQFVHLKRLIITRLKGEAHPANVIYSRAVMGGAARGDLNNSVPIQLKLRDVQATFLTKLEILQN